MDDTDRLPRLQHRDNEVAPIPESADQLVIRDARIVQHVRRVDDRAIDDRKTVEATWGERILRPEQLEAFIVQLISGGEVQECSIEAEHAAEQRVAEAGRVLGYRLEDRLGIGRRAGNYAQDLSRGGLLLESLLRLVEQTCVLDR